MDLDPAGAHEAVQRAIEELEPSVELRRLRMRRAAGRHFADVVIGVPPGAAVGQGHAAADAVEAAVQDALPESDVVVHVEPLDEAALRERVHAAAMTVPRVREVHNLRVLSVGGQLEVALHLKLPGELSLDDAHAVASTVEQAIARAVPEVASVQTHLEPLREPGAGHAPAAADVQASEAAVARVVSERTGHPPRELRFLQTDEGLVAFLTVGFDPSGDLAAAHALASEIEQQVRRAAPQIADVIVHTEPG
jgi:divalent metal cation (Fe/Co/Zn/Cd) transporter